MAALANWESPPKSWRDIRKIAPPAFTGERSGGPVRADMAAEPSIRAKLGELALSHAAILPPK
ncbi:hypothetical protein [Poseidonocella pacifica]|uniref:hypothetical protein n=1 Tax=Poseidonocella pacifica TaxID=871651 RepID=UPI001113ABF4|nr:hypothetical protein [Poseidonocella pacifica]